MPEPLIYLDHNATTPLDPRVLNAMLPYLRDAFANASSPHAAGRAVARAVDVAREQVASAIGADPREIVWTSGATEANNLAIRGAAASPAYRGRSRIVTVATEHPAVLEPCHALALQGYEVVTLGVDVDGMIDLEGLQEAVTPETLLVSVMFANNETGVLQPISEIGALCQDRSVLFHTDATQAFGREGIDVNRAHIDLLSVSAHKAYGPKGSGALFVRRKGPRARIEPMLLGGGHERGMRSGTLNVPGIVGLGVAAGLAAEGVETGRVRTRTLRDDLERRLEVRFPGLMLNGHRTNRLANTLNATLPGIPAQRVAECALGLAVSSSAACTSAKRLPSYVLRAMGLSEEAIRSSLRFSLGRFTTQAEIECVADRLADAIADAASEAPACDPDPF
jgi:cysteine desulfurase